MTKFRFKPIRRRRTLGYSGDHPEANYKTFDIHLPLALYKRLELYRLTRNIPMGRLIAQAVFNELQKDKPFDIQFKPSTPFLPTRHDREAQILLKYLKKNNRGMALDLLLISTEDIGLSQDEIYWGVRELHHFGQVDILDPHNVPWIMIKKIERKKEV